MKFDDIEWPFEELIMWHLLITIAEFFSMSFIKGISPIFYRIISWKSIVYLIFRCNRKVTIYILPKSSKQNEKPLNSLTPVDARGRRTRAMVVFRVCVIHVRRISLTWTTSVSKGRGILDRMSDAKSSITSCDDFPPLDVYENKTKALKNGNFRTKNKLSHWKQEGQIQ